MIFCFHFYFLFRTICKRTADDNDFHHYYGIFFSTTLKLLDRSYVQVLLQQLGGTLTAAFEMTSYN